MHKRDYEELINNLDDEKVIEMMRQLGADRYVNRDTYILFPTICHNTVSSEASMKLYYYKDNKVFMCYTECGGMSIFKFLKNYYETRQYEYDWVEDILKVIEGCSTKSLEGISEPKVELLRDRYSKTSKEATLETYSPNLLSVFNKVYPIEWLNDGISKKAMDKFNIKYSISQNKIIIPHYNINGELVGIRGRALNEWEVENIGKYTPVKIENKMYNHKLTFNLYGLNHNKNNILKNGYVFVFESEKSVLQMESFSRDNCAVAICGSYFNKFQLFLLLKNCYPNEIVICFDKEEEPGQDKYFLKLWNLCKKYSDYCKCSFIYDRKGLIGFKDSPTDKGEEVFEELLRNRIQVK